MLKRTPVDAPTERLGVGAFLWSHRRFTLALAAVLGVAGWQAVRALLDEVGPSIVADNLVPNMSGGQQQRVAIARAVVMNPDLVLADEPTGNLDSKPADDVFDVMGRVDAAGGWRFLIVTHNIELARRCDRIVEVTDGRITC